MKKIFFLLAALFALNVQVLAESKDIKGKLLDNDGKPIKGATILVKGTAQSVTTDEMGNFELTAETDSVLLVSADNYEAQEIEVAGQESLSLTLIGTADVILQDDIVVTGYRTVERKSLASSTSSVNMEDANKQPVVNASEVLQGRASGVTVQNSGQPGSAPIVRVRGLGTTNSNDPLYVIDGFQTENAYVLNNLNPADIEQITVLKDASASIYGARAANGVIVIKTKSGQINQKPHLVYSTSYGTFEVGDLPKLLNAQQHGEMIWQSIKNDGGSPQHAQYGKASVPVVPTTLKGVDKPTTVAPNGTDWLDAIFDPAPYQEHNLSLTGGFKEGKYLVSVNHLKKDGVMIETGIERIVSRINTEVKVNDRISVGQHLNVSNEKSRLGVGGAIQNALFSSPLIPLYDDNGDYAGTYSNALQLGIANNPYADLKRSKDNYQKVFRVLGDAYIQVNLLDGLDFKSVIAGTQESLNSRGFTKLNPEHGEAITVNTLNENTHLSTEWIWTNTLNYVFDFEDHSVDVLLGYESVSNEFKGHGAARTDYLFEDPDFYLLSNGSGKPVITSAVANSYKLYSYFGSILYDFQKKIFVTGTLRSDNTSRFASANQSAVFPSLSVAYEVTQDFDLKMLNYLKARVSWGELGNQSLDSNANPSQNFSVIDENLAAYAFNGSGSASAGALLFAAGNPNLTWETTVAQGIGFDYELFDSLVYGSIDYFSRETKDLIAQDVALINNNAIDANAPLVNIGTVNNTGVEFLIGHANELDSGVSYEIEFNISSYKNEVKKLLAPYQVGNSFRIGAMTRTMEGQPISVFYGKVITGLDGDGKFVFKDIDGDGKVNDNDRTVIGSPHPDFTYGLNLKAAYKNFDVSMFIVGSEGNDIFNYQKLYYELPYFFHGNRSTRVFDSNMPALTQTPTQVEPSSFYVEDGSYIRVKNIQFGYSLPENLLEFMGVTKARVNLTLVNPFTFTDYGGMDPESASRGLGTLSLGIESNSYPIDKAVIFGTTLEF